MKSTKNVKNLKSLKILVIDVGGTHVKMLATGHKERIEIRSGRKMTPQRMVTIVRALTGDWKYDVVSIGYPGFVIDGRPITEPYHLGHGWVGFDFEKMFDRPVKILNDAAMQALGSYEGGRMLFLGLGTGLGSTLITSEKNGDPVLLPMELAHLHYRKERSYEDYLGLSGLKHEGKKTWRHHVVEVASQLKVAMQADTVVLGGGNARLLKDLPSNMLIGNNDNAFEGGYRLWKDSLTVKTEPQK